MSRQLDMFVDNAVLAATTYAEFRDLLVRSNCTRCALHAGRTHIVPDRGNPDARIMAVGEAPGENEDLKGQAFVGRAGRLLDNLVKSIGMDTNRDMIICNIAKCRPPKNRPPRPDEAEACLPYLRKQIDLVKPEVILLLGATALRHMIGTRKGFTMKSSAGRFFEVPEYPGIRFMVLYHPAFLLRDPRKIPVMLDHLQHLKKKVSG